MPYGVIPLIASILLGIQHAAISDAPVLSKAVVSLIVVGAVLAWWQIPRWSLFASIVQAVVGIYVLVYIKMSEERRDR